jgi:hypothetical protein
MFSDPQTVTVNSVAKVMPRTQSDGTKSIYKLSDENFVLTISHTKAGRDRIRSMVRIDQRAVVPDPLTSVNDYETLSFYCVIDRPSVGFDSTAVNNLVAGLKTWLDSTAVGKLFGQES